MTDVVDSADKGTVVVDQKASPNDDYLNDDRLDESGNPKESDPTKPPEKTTEEIEADRVAKEKADKEAEDEESKNEFDQQTATEVGEFLEAAGLTPTDVAKEATENDGKVSVETMQKLVDKHGTAVAKLLARDMLNLHNQAVGKVQKQDQAVFDHVAKAFEGITNQSGKESWAELSAWAKANVPDAERKEINKVLAQGGLSATLAVDVLVAKFNASEQTTQKAQLLDGDNLSDGHTKADLTKAQYVAELRVLTDKKGLAENSPEVTALNTRRMRSIERGVK